jgi:5-methylthioribose kinase
MKATISIVFIILLFGCATMPPKFYNLYAPKNSNQKSVQKYNVFIRTAYQMITIGENYYETSDYGGGTGNVYRCAIGEAKKVDYINLANIDEKVPENYENIKNMDNFIDTSIEIQYLFDIKVVHKEIYAVEYFAKMITAFSLTIIPTMFPCYYDVTLNVINDKKEIIKTYTRNAKLTEWVQLLLVFVHPWHNRYKDEDILIGTCLKNIYQQIAEDKILKKIN